LPIKHCIARFEIAVRDLFPTSGNTMLYRQTKKNKVLFITCYGNADYAYIVANHTVVWLP
jgi:hypothetical protein